MPLSRPIAPLRALLPGWGGVLDSLHFAVIALLLLLGANAGDQRVPWLGVGPMMASRAFAR
jgi:hypothetical protein